MDEKKTAVGVSGLSVKQQRARDYYARNREAIRLQQKLYKSAPAGREVNNRCADHWYRSVRARGVVTWRLKPPRGFARLAAQLRWRTTLRSTNGSHFDGSVWDYMAMFGDSHKIRFREKMADAASSSGPGLKWLRAFDSRSFARETNT
jgi:hypothetical protein